MKLKWYKPSMDRDKVRKIALRAACEKLYLLGAYKSPQKAMNDMIRIAVKHCH